MTHMIRGWWAQSLERRPIAAATTAMMPAPPAAAAADSDRRRHPRVVARRNARLVVNISLLDASSATAFPAPHSMTLGVYTHDLSATGLSLVAPAFFIDEKYIRIDDRPVQITLNLAADPFEVQAVPVRIASLSEQSSERGLLVGARLIGLRGGGGGYARYTQYLQTLR